MNPHAAIRAQLNVIHGELAARGIHSAKIENATYSIETLSRAYMAPTVNREWQRCKFARSHIKIGDLLLKHLNNLVSDELIYDALYYDRTAGDFPEIDIIGIFICKMRKRLKDHDSAYWIENVTGQGYRLILKPSALALTALQELQAH